MSCSRLLQIIRQNPPHARQPGPELVCAAITEPIYAGLMADSVRGNPCWFELSTADVDAAESFYGSVLDWKAVDSGMPDMTYHLAGPSDGMVAGVMGMDHLPPGTPPNWLLYVAVDALDATVEQVLAGGGSTIAPPTEIPGTGRFAVIADPQGAVLGLLEPLPMDTPAISAFDPSRVGHGGWIELMTPGQDQAMSFYGDLFGWTRGDAMDMGEMGTYQLFDQGGTSIGGMMGLGDAPMPVWMVYFVVDKTSAAVDRITAAGGSIHHGPSEVPGGQYIAVAQDPAGAFFAVVGNP